MHAELAIGKTGGQQIEHQHGIPERLHRGIGEAQCRYPLALHGPGTLELLQGLFGQNRIVRDGLDFEHTPVGLKSDVAKRRQVVETLSDVEVAGVVDGGLGAERLAFFVILLNARAFVVDVQRRDHAVGDHARAEGSGRGFGDAAVEDQLHLLGPSQIEILADVLRKHVILEIESIDRMYLNAIVPRLQIVEGALRFIRQQRKAQVASTNAVEPMTRAFVTAIEQFVAQHQIPVVSFQKGQRKDELAAEMRARFPQRDGVVFVGKAQEKCTVYRTEKRHNPKTKRAYAWIVKSTALVNHYYFYCITSTASMRTSDR